MDCATSAVSSALPLNACSKSRRRRTRSLWFSRFTSIFSTELENSATSSGSIDRRLTSRRDRTISWVRLESLACSSSRSWLDFAAVRAGAVATSLALNSAVRWVAPTAGKACEFTTDWAEEMWRRISQPATPDESDSADMHKKAKNSLPPMPSLLNIVLIIMICRIGVRCLALRE